MLQVRIKCSKAIRIQGEEGGTFAHMIYCCAVNNTNASLEPRYTSSSAARHFGLHSISLSYSMSFGTALVDIFIYIYMEYMEDIHKYL